MARNLEFKPRGWGHPCAGPRTRQRPAARRRGGCAPGLLCAAALLTLSARATLALPLPDDPAGWRRPGDATEPDETLTGRYLPRLGARTLSKKALTLEDKARRPALRLAPGAPGRVTGEALPPPGSRIEPVVTLVNPRTREALALLPGQVPTGRFDRLVRDHFTNQATEMDAQLLTALARAARHFAAPRIDIVSGYRSPKYNLMLRKKGRQVAAESQHTQGRAVDFRVRGVGAAELLRFVRGLRLGGVGFYPHSQFVHCDTGPVRYWRGS